MRDYTFFIVLLFISMTAIANARDLRAVINDPPLQYSGSPEWSDDYLVSATEPVGKPSGVYQQSTSTVYVSLPDTTIQQGSSIVILSSTNNGASWSNIASMTPAEVIPKTKMIIGSADSVYCFFISGVTVYCWNVLNGRVTQVRGVGFRDFDVASSSTGSMYIFMDSLGTNNIPRYGSSDGGVTWGARALVTGSGAHPRIGFSATGDTLILHYYGPVLADTATSIIRGARYRESAPGTLATVGSFIDVARSNSRKSEFAAVRHGSSAWIVYTTDDAGDINIRCKISNNGGNTYVDSALIASLSTANELWLDTRYHNRAAGGIDVIYASSADVNRGIINHMNHITAVKSGMLSFSNAAQFADNPPVISSVGYLPVLIPYYNSEGDVGAVWVGTSASSGDGGEGVYFDRLNATSVLSLTVSLEACLPASDTVTVELRQTVSPYALVDSKRALLSNGSAPVYFTNALDGVNYYIVVKHRNSVETWSAAGQSFSNYSLSYDFTTAASQAYGSNMILVGGEYSLYTGDVNADGIVDGADGLLIDNDAFSFVSGYVVTDLNCDGTVDGTDAVYADNNSFQFIGVIRP